MKQTNEQYKEIARRDWERRIYKECDAEDRLEDAKREMFGDESEYLDDDLGAK